MPKFSEKSAARLLTCHPDIQAVLYEVIKYRDCTILEGVRTIETLNGGSRGNENEQAASLAARKGYARIGGSDSHIVSHIGRCATRLHAEVKNMNELVASLKEGRCEAVKLEDGAWIPEN